MRAIDKREFDEWLTHPVTIAVRELLRKRQREIESAWGKGDFTFATAEATAMKSAEKIGVITGLAFASELDHEDLEMYDDERERAIPSGSSGPTEDGGAAG